MSLRQTQKSDYKTHISQENPFEFTSIRCGQYCCVIQWKDNIAGITCDCNVEKDKYTERRLRINQFYPSSFDLFQQKIIEEAEKVQLHYSQLFQIYEDNSLKIHLEQYGDIFFDAIVTIQPAQNLVFKKVETLCQRNCAKMQRELQNIHQTVSKLEKKFLEVELEDIRYKKYKENTDKQKQICLKMICKHKNQMQQRHLQIQSSLASMKSSSEAQIKLLKDQLVKQTQKLKQIEGIQSDSEKRIKNMGKSYQKIKVMFKQHIQKHQKQEYELKLRLEGLEHQIKQQNKPVLPDELLEEIQNSLNTPGNTSQPISSHQPAKKQLSHSSQKGETPENEKILRHSRNERKENFQSPQPGPKESGGKTKQQEQKELKFKFDISAQLKQINERFKALSSELSKHDTQIKDNLNKIAQNSLNLSTRANQIEDNFTQIQELGQRLEDHLMECLDQSAMLTSFQLDQQSLQF